MTNSPKHPQTYESILQKLHAYRRKKRWVLISKGLFQFLACQVLFLFLLLAAEALFRLPPFLRQTLLGIWGAGSLVCWVKTVIFPGGVFIGSREAFSDEALAAEVGGAFPDIRDELIDALQIIRDIRTNVENYSKELADVFLKTVFKKISGRQILSLISLKPAIRALETFSLSLFIFAVFFVVFNRTLGESVTHYLHPTQSFREKEIQAISVSPGDWTCLSGDTLRGTVKIKGAFRRPIQIFWREQSRKVSQKKGVLPDSTGIYSFELPNLKENLTYFVQAGKQKTQRFAVTVEKRPMVRSLQAELIFPAYTGMGSRLLEENQGDITALKGTRVRLRIRANKPIAKAAVVFKQGKPLRLRLQNRGARGEFSVRRDNSYFIRLEDENGHRNADPIHYRIVAVPDQPPVVEITRPGQDVDVNEDMILPLQIHAEDDFGFSRAELNYRVHHAVVVTEPDTNFHALELQVPRNGGSKLDFDYTWQLSSLQMLPGDYAEYFVKIFDNDAVSGFKSAVSRTYMARFPSMAEIYHETTSAQDETIQELEELVRESKELKREVNKVADEMKRNPEMNWTKKQELQELAEKQQRLTQKSEKVKDQLDQVMDRLRQNNMLSEETIRKYMEIQKLFNEVLTPEMKKILEDLKKALEKMDSRKLERTANKFKLTENDFQQSLERTLNLLKRLQIEQRLDQAKKMAENLKERQKTVNRSLEKAAAKDRQTLRKLEKKIQEDTQRFKEELKALQKEMTEFPDMKAEKMNAPIEKAGESAEQMQQMTQALQENNPQNAQKSGKMSEQSLQDLSQMLSQMKKQIVNKQKQEVMKQLARSSTELLRLSKEQEALQNQTKGLSSVSPKFNQMAEKQLSLLNNLNQLTKELYQLSQKTFFVTPEIGKAIGKAMGNMKTSLSQMEERNGRGASGHQKQAMGALNEAVLNIQQSMQSLASAASSVGMEEYLKQLQKMAGQQQGINQQTLQLSLQLSKQGRLTEGEQGRLRRLAAQQRQLEKMMRDLQEKYGEHSNVLGNMQEMAKEMGDIAKRMELSQLDRETIRRQQKILSRLLDAQRSVRQRDFSKRRKSEAGKSFIAKSPGVLPRGLLQKRDRLQEDILRAKKAGYSEDFLNLIQSYYEALYEETHAKN
ncbi:MAG: hypothetical protein GXO76_00410 [Calditrichaeota bacterium]|nr:hypothetical protein [Calditrichota bacterium]